MNGITNVPDPDCSTCDGVGWYEGGKALMTQCDCLRPCDKAVAEQAVHGSPGYGEWKRLYASLPAS